MKAKIIMPSIWFVSLVLFVSMWIYKPFSFVTHCVITSLWAVWTIYFLFSMLIILTFKDREEKKLKSRPEKESMISKITGAFMRFLTEIGGEKKEEEEENY